MNEAVKAYTAGYLDADGCIYISKQAIKNGSYVYRLYVTVSSTVKSSLEYLMSIWGGSISIYKEKRKNNHDKWQWCVAGNDACEMLLQVEEFMTIKGKQAALAVSFQLNRKRYGWQGRPKELIEKQEWCYQQMKNLKKYGKIMSSKEGR